MDKTQELLKKVIEARREYDAMKDVANVAERRWRSFEQELVKHMAENKSDLANYDGVTARPVQQFSAAVNKDTQQQTVDWLLNTIGDITDYTEEKVRRHKVISLLKERHERGEPIPAFFEAQPTITLRLEGYKNDRTRTE